MVPSSILAATLVVSAALATWTTLRSSNETIERYVSVWEEEVARNLLLRGDHELFEKIRAQIKDLATEVTIATPQKLSAATRPQNVGRSKSQVGEVNDTANDTINDTTNAATADVSEAAISVADRCFAEQILRVTLYGTPAGEIRICRSPQKLLLRSLASPVFAFGLMTGILFAFWLTRRRAREESNRAVNELAIRVAHDIRAPLMALKIAATARLPFYENASAEDSKNLIEAATKRIEGIADELLALSRPKPNRMATDGRLAEADQRAVDATWQDHGASATATTGSANAGSIGIGQTELPSGTNAAKTEINGATPPEPIKTQTEAIRELIREKNVTASLPIHFELTPANPPEGLAIAASSSDFERVVSNLLQNSVEATIEKSKMSAGEIKPRINIQMIEGDSRIGLTIRDNGIGIPRDILPRIGEVGFSYGKHGGNGVGLSSAKRWAESLGGELEIRSLEGTGTEVRLTLPR